MLKMFLLLVTVALSLRFSSISAQSEGVDLTLEPGAKGMDVIRAAITKIESSGIFAGEPSLADPFMRRMAYVESRDGGAENYPEGGIWNLDEQKFMETKSYLSQSLLDAYVSIDACFGVDWTNLPYAELQKPLYSGLATRLQIYNLERNEMAKVPRKAQQGNYWVRHFPKSGVNESKWDEDVKELDRGGTEECSVNTDVAFVLDESGSVGADNYEFVKNFTYAFIDSIKDSNDDKIALIIYSNDARVEYDFTNPINNNKSSLLGGILALQYMGGATNTPDALCSLLSLPWRDGIGVLRLAVVLTDGQSNRQSVVCGTLEPAAARVHNLEPPVQVFAIGIGDGINYNELDIIASDRQYISNVTSFTTGFVESQEIRAYEICNTIEQPVDVGELNDGVTGKGETTRLSLTADSPDEGITLRLCVMEGSMELFASTTTKNPNSAFYDYKAMVNKTEQTEVSCVTNYFEPKEGPLRSKRNPATASSAMTVYVSLVGQKDNNVFMLNSSTGNVVFDADECVLEDPCDDLATCTNTDGSFFCVCDTGYTVVNRTECEDIDECKQAQDADDRICLVTEDCINTIGSYNCRVKLIVIIIVVAVIGALLAAIACIFLVCCCCYYCSGRRKVKGEDTEAILQYENTDSGAKPSGFDNPAFNKKQVSKAVEEDVSDDDSEAGWNYTLTLTWQRNKKKEEKEEEEEKEEKEIKDEID